MLGGTVINVEILVGLPGSGKTYYTNNRCTKKGIYGVIVDFDDYKGGKNKYPGLKKVLWINSDYYGIFLYNQESLIICDGLFLTNEAQEKIVREWVELFNKEDTLKTSTLNIKFIYFKENRDACLNNDSYREKERSAHITIKNSKFEKPDIKNFKNIFNQENINFEIEEKEVYTMTNYDGEFKSLRNEYWSKKFEKDVLVSEHWCVGGNICGYDGYDEPCSPEEKPDSFEEFDKLLEQNCPDITFLQYKKIYKECVTIEEDEERDYYGGTQYFNFYCCDLKKLYEMLQERGYIKNE